MFTREDYMAKKVSHHGYYGQFVNDSVIHNVITAIGKTKIENSKDEHFNDIPLHKWDNVYLPNIVLINIGKANGSNAYSPADKVCIVKCAAKMIRDAAEK